jgi:CBS domain-containing protein
MIDYSVFRVYTSEKARFEGRELSQAIVSYVRSLHAAARCVVLRGIEACYESGETASARVMDLSYNLPLVIDILVPSAEAPHVAERLEAMVGDGFVIALSHVVASYRSSERLLPAHLRVGDVMSPRPIAARPDFSARALAEILIDADLDALPVVDEVGKLVGIATQADLIAKAGMPGRIGLFGALPVEEVSEWRRRSELVCVESLMTAKPVAIGEDRPLAEALHLMLREKHRRIPVVDARGALSGMLSSVDILRAISSERPLERRARAEAQLGTPTKVGDIARREELALSPETGLAEAIDALMRGGAEVAAVVDREGRLLGTVDDFSLLGAVEGRKARPPIWKVFRPASKRGVTVGALMKEPVATLSEDSSVEEALALMAERGAKRLPVVDGQGRFRGMLWRDSVLIALSHLV